MELLNNRGSIFMSTLLFLISFNSYILRIRRIEYNCMPRGHFCQLKISAPQPYIYQWLCPAAFNRLPIFTKTTVLPCLRQIRAI